MCAHLCKYCQIAKPPLSIKYSLRNVFLPVAEIISSSGDTDRWPCCPWLFVLPFLPPSLGPSFSKVPVRGFVLTRCWRTLISHLIAAPPFFITEPGFIQDPPQGRTYWSRSVGIIPFPFGEAPGFGVTGLEVNQAPMSC